MIPFDPAEKKAALRMLSNGLFVLTARSGDTIAASTISWTTQCSFVPPLVAMALRKDSKAHTLFEQSGNCALHPLALEQVAMAKAFFTHDLEIDDRSINGFRYEIGPRNLPIFDEVAACLILEKRAVTDVGGDHVLAVAEVVGARCSERKPALTVEASPWEYGG